MRQGDGSFVFVGRWVRHVRHGGGSFALEVCTVLFLDVETVTSSCLSVQNKMEVKYFNVMLNDHPFVCFYPS